MAYPISMIPYANMAPYRMLGAPEGCRFIDLVPRESVIALRENRVLAAAVPVGGLFTLGDLVEPMGPYGIAARERSMSVLFYGRKPLDRFGPEDRIRLTTESASSVRLLYLIMGRKLGFGRLPYLAGPGEPVDGALVIGNKALAWAWQLETGPSAQGGPQLSASTQVADLASEWFGQEGLPFVFARWVVRRDAPSGAKEALLEWMARFRREETSLVERAIPLTARELCAPEAAVARYFSVIRRSLEDEDLAGQARFDALFRRYGREPLFEKMPAGTVPAGS